MYHVNELADVSIPILNLPIIYLALPSPKQIQKLNDATTFFTDLKNLGIHTLLLDEKKWYDYPNFEHLLRGAQTNGFEILTNENDIKIHFLLNKNEFHSFIDFKNIFELEKATLLTLGDTETLQKIVLPYAGHFYSECVKMLILLTFSQTATPCVCDIDILENKERYMKGSLFKFYQHLVALRNENHVLINGIYQDVCPEHDKLWLFTRTSETEQWLIVINCSISHVIFDLPKNLKNIKKVFILSNYGIGGKKGRGAEAVASLRLRPFEARLYQLKK